MSEAASPTGYMEKAGRALKAARMLLTQSDTEGACNRAYYAMFHAALWAAGTHAPGTVIKTHGGLISIFGQELVKTGKIDAVHGRALSQVHKTRLLADYTCDPPIDGDAKEAIALADAFVEAVQSTFFAKPAKRT